MKSLMIYVISSWCCVHHLSLFYALFAACVVAGQISRFVLNMWVECQRQGQSFGDSKRLSHFELGTYSAHTFIHLHFIIHIQHNIVIPQSHHITLKHIVYTATTCSNCLWHPHHFIDQTITPTLNTTWSQFIFILTIIMPWHHRILAKFGVCMCCRPQCCVHLLLVVFCALTYHWLCCVHIVV